MRRTWLLLALASCSKPQKLWMDVHATQLHVGMLEANIPDGWRDFNELVTKPDRQPPAGARMILLESAPNTARIMVMPLPGEISGDQCAEAAKLWQAELGDKGTFSNAEGANFNGNKGCLMKISGPKISGEQAVVTPQGGSTVTVLCMGRGPELASACDKVIYGLRVTPPK